MQIEDIIDDWCAKQNKQTGANAGLILMTLGFALFIGLAFQQEQIKWLAGSVLSFAFWVLYSPRRCDVYDLRRTQNVRTVPDSLLDFLAEHRDVPAWAKAAIAQQLKQKGSISFEGLFAIDDEMAAVERKRLIAEGKGFQKMAGFVVSDANDAQNR